MSLVTDMNDRERRRYVQEIDDHIRVCASLRETLCAGDDDKALIALISVVMNKEFAKNTRELIEIFAAAANVTIPDRPPPSD